MSELVPGKSALERAKLIASQLYRSTPDLFHNHKSSLLSSNLNPQNYECPRPTSSTEDDMVRCVEVAKEFIRAKRILINLNEQLESLKSRNIQQELEFERQIEDLRKRIETPVLDLVKVRSRS
jgi:hypothetical protein